MGNVLEKPPEPVPESSLPPKVRIAKRRIEVYYERFFHENRLRARELAAVDYRARCGEIDEQTRLHLRRDQFLRELEWVRRKRKPGSMRDYHVVRKIGQGSYGSVFLVREKATERLFAMKKLRKDEMVGRSQVKHVWLERFVLAAVGQHPHVVKMYASFQDDTCLYFIMEYLPGGDLLNMLIRHERLSENWARFYIAELVVAINALHRTGIIHRDIKPDNVLFNARGHVCLSDFGLSKSLLNTIEASKGGGGSKDSTPFIEPVRKGAYHMPFADRMAAWKAVARNHVFSAVGTPSYIAPEVLNETAYHESCDWWSVGAILYEMLIGVPPFLAESPADTIMMIRNWREYFEFPDWPESMLSADARDLISRLICDPACRLGATRGLSEFKAHPFFKGVDWNSLSDMQAPFVPTLEHDDDTRYFDDEIPEPPAETSDDTPPSSSVSSPPGSLETPLSVSAPAAPNSSSPPDRRRRTNMPLAARSSDIEFIGFTYVPWGEDNRADWQTALRQTAAAPVSAPPRSVSAGPRTLVPRRARPADAGTLTSSGDDAEEPGMQPRSLSTGARQPAARAMSTPRLPSSSPARPAAYPRPAAGQRAPPQAAAPTPPPAAENAVAVGTPAGKRQERSFEGSTVTVEENGATTPSSATPAPAEDSIVAGLGAVAVTEEYPATDIAPRTPPARRDATADAASEPGVSEAGSTFTPDGVNPAEPPGADKLPPAHLPAPGGPIVRTNPLPRAVNPLTPAAPASPDRRLLGGPVGSPVGKMMLRLDENALVERSIEVPSAREVAVFRADAEEGLEEAAAELTQTNGAGDIASVVRSARRQVDGEADELRRNLSTEDGG